MTASAPLRIPPDGLAFRAEQLIESLGYVNPGSYTAYGFECCDRRNFLHVEQLPRDRRETVLASHQPPVLRFWYRQHRLPLLAITPVEQLGYDWPANDAPGMLRLALDPTGRLIAFEARPETDAGTATGAVNETPLFEAAGLDRSRFTPAPPQELPPMAFDMRLAWTGTYRDDLPGRVHVDAAWWQGRLVYFGVTGDWHRAEEAPVGLRAAFPYVLATATVVAILGALLAAWYNLRSGRGDRRGAAFVAGVVFVCVAGEALLTGAHVAMLSVLYPWAMSLAFATLLSALAWTGYVAIEPYVRRQAPDALISWTRLYSGRLRDPLVASHLLVGIGVMLANSMVGDVVMRLVADIGVLLPEPGPLVAFGSTASFAAVLLARLGGTLLLALRFLLLIVVLRPLLRRTWLADLAACMVIGAFGLYAYTGVVGVVMNTLFVAVTLVLLRRFGLLAMLAAWWTYITITVLPASLDAWYSGRFLFTLALPAAVAAWSLWVILSARRQATAETGA